MRRDEIPTPALLLDLPRFEANVQALADYCKKSGCGFRPHAKTHKCPEIARRQIASGALGVCVATVPEAEAMVAAGIRGVLLTSPLGERSKTARMAALAQKGGVMLSLSSAEGANLLDASASAADVRIDVLIDLDVGDQRTGVSPGTQALELAKHIARCKHLRLRGLQAYAGHASHTVGFEARAKRSRDAMGQAIATRDLLRRERFEIEIVSGGSTGTYNIDSSIAGVTELQVGSYVFMDADYRRIGGRSGDVYDDFQPSLTVLSTVVCASRDDRVTIDAGTKAFATDVSSRPEAVGRDGLVYQRFGDEFGSLTAGAGGKLPRLGERVEFIVPHCDPTVNLYDRIYAMRGDRVEGEWPILARRENVS
jgi:D-serine deaminase-like pyridoxal phosphate-dependent protein